MVVFEVDEFILFILYMNEWSKVDNIECLELLDLLGLRFFLYVWFCFYVKVLVRWVSKLFYLVMMKVKNWV